MQIGRRSSLLSAEQNPATEELMIDVSAVETLLKDLQPLIHYTAFFLRLTQWKDNSNTKYSLVLLLGLIMWCKIHPYVMFLLPLILVLINIQCETFFPAATRSTSKVELVDDLTDIRNTVWLLASAKDWIQKSDTLCRAYYQYYSVATTKTRSVICFGVTSLFTIMYAGWTFLVYQQMITGCASLVWFFIVAIMCLYSPWANPICVACVRAVGPLVHYWETREDNEPPVVCQPLGLVNVYCFQIYHHQRWWFPTGWTNILLPQDPPVWYVVKTMSACIIYPYSKNKFLYRSDEHLEPTPRLHDFKLPSTTYFGPPNELNQRRVVSWIWTDPFWSKQKDTVGDRLSWQYGKKWLQWSSQSNGSGFFTRRRKWFRYAQRTETWVTFDSSPASSIIGGSRTTGLGSNYNWDDTPPISPSTSSTSIISESRQRPILLDNNIRRSSVSETFITPVLSCSRPTVNYNHLKHRLSSHM